MDDRIINDILLKDRINGRNTLNNDGMLSDKFNDSE